jgi:hypothetical protein
MPLIIHTSRDYISVIGRSSTSEFLIHRRPLDKNINYKIIILLRASEMWSDSNLQELYYNSELERNIYIEDNFLLNDSANDVSIKVESRFPNITLTNNGSIGNLNINSNNYPMEININQIDTGIMIKQELSELNEAETGTTNNWKEDKKELTKLNKNLKKLIHKTKKDVAVCLEEVKLEVGNYIDKQKKILLMSLTQLDLTVEEKICNDDETNKIMQAIVDIRGNTFKVLQEFRIIN